MKTGQFHYPTDTDTVLSCGPEGTFAVHGIVDAGVGRIRCQIKDRSGNVTQGDLLYGPPDKPGAWGVAFAAVALGQGPYTLELLSVEDDISLALRENFDLEIKPHNSTTIDYPLSGATVHHNFTAYGTTDATAISGQMVFDNGTPVTGTPHLNRTGWSVAFTNLDSSHSEAKWTLNIYENSTASPPVAAHSDNLKVIV
jgi:hypothetical protein